MKFSKLFLVLSMACVACHMPMQAATFKPRAITALAAAAGSMLATGLTSIVDSVKNDKYQEALSNSKNFDYEAFCKKRWAAEAAFELKVMAGMAIVIATICGVAFWRSKSYGQSPIQPTAVNKDELTVKA